MKIRDKLMGDLLIKNDYVIPKVIRDHSSAKILCSEFVEGLELDEIE